MIAARSALGLFALAAVLLSSVAHAQRGPTPAQRIALLEERLEALESRPATGDQVTAQVLELMQRVETLEREIRELRGQVEQLNHEMESVGRRQRELYLDLDRRLQSLETGRGRPMPATEPAPGASPSLPPAAGADLGDERGAYDAAFRMLQEGRYPAAIAAFKEYLERYPDGRLADNAQYWLGEAYYVTRDYRTALVEFRVVLDRHPQSQKVPDALLKIGYVHYELQEWDEARRVLTDVAGRAAGTTIARLAEQRLQRMRQEGR